MEQFDITVVGAGVVGLAVAAELSRNYQNIMVLEQEDSFGRQTSSRNSEVIHAGIYYPRDSLKSNLCIEGLIRIYEYCRRNSIQHKRIGKFIVAVKDKEVTELEQLFEHASSCGVEDIHLISKDQIKKLEPHINAASAIWSASTGIIDSHGLMKQLAAEALSRKAQIAYKSRVFGLEKQKQGYTVCAQNGADQVLFRTRILINCAGLGSENLSRMVGIKNKEYKLKLCKGDYFRAHNNKGKFISRLIYPLPRKKGAGLGVHSVLDLNGGLRLGPDAEYVDKIDYQIREEKKRDFYENVKEFLPFIEPEDLGPDTSGIRPKLQGRDEEFRDFVINEESEAGYPGFINLVGIESPGLTCCLTIANKVGRMVKKIS